MCPQFKSGSSHHIHKSLVISILPPKNHPRISLLFRLNFFHCPVSVRFFRLWRPSERQPPASLKGLPVSLLGLIQGLPASLSKHFRTGNKRSLDDTSLAAQVADGRGRRRASVVWSSPASTGVGGCGGPRLAAVAAPPGQSKLEQPCQRRSRSPGIMPALFIHPEVTEDHAGFSGREQRDLHGHMRRVSSGRDARSRQGLPNSRTGLM